MIASEIFELYEGNVVSSNEFTYENTEIYIAPLHYVDHYGNLIQPSPTVSQTPLPTPTESEKFTSSDLF